MSIGWVNPVLLVVAPTVRGASGEVIRIISARKANAMNEPTTMKYKLDPRHPKQPTVAQRKRLQAFAHKPDADIDYSDIPALSPEFWAKHRPARVEPKAQVTLRIDQDVLDYFKDAGKGYQTRINDVLRSFVVAHTSRR